MSKTREDILTQTIMLKRTLKRAHFASEEQFSDSENHSENHDEDHDENSKRSKSHDNDNTQRSASEHRFDNQNKKSRIDASHAQSQRRQKQDKVQNDIVCYHCEKTDHIRSDCSDLDKSAVTHVRAIDARDVRNIRTLTADESKNDRASQTSHQRSRKDQ